MRGYHKCLILQIVLTPDCLCTTEKCGEPHRNSSLEITLTSSAWIKEAQCKVRHLWNLAAAHLQFSGVSKTGSVILLNFLVYIPPCLQEHWQTVCLSESIPKHPNSAQGAWILTLVLLFFELGRTLILRDPASEECPLLLQIPWING